MKRYEVIIPVIVIDLRFAMPTVNVWTSYYRTSLINILQETKKIGKHNPTRNGCWRSFKVILGKNSGRWSHSSRQTLKQKDNKRCWYFTFDISISTHSLTNELPEHLTNELPEHLTDGLSDHLTDELPEVNTGRVTWTPDWWITWSPDWWVTRTHDWQYKNK